MGPPPRCPERRTPVLPGGGKHLVRCADLDAWIEAHRKPQPQPVDGQYDPQLFDPHVDRQTNAQERLAGVTVTTTGTCTANAIRLKGDEGGAAEGAGTAGEEQSAIAQAEGARRAGQRRGSPATSSSERRPAGCPQQRVLTERERLLGPRHPSPASPARTSPRCSATQARSRRLRHVRRLRRGCRRQRRFPRTSAPPPSSPPRSAGACRGTSAPLLPPPSSSRASSWRPFRGPAGTACSYTRAPRRPSHTFLRTRWTPGMPRLAVALGAVAPTRRPDSVEVVRVLVPLEDAFAALPRSSATG
jgi:hypothetical protein